MNKLLIAVALCAALAACKKEETTDPAPVDGAATPTAEAPATEAPVAEAPAETMPADPAAPVNAGLPKECEDYLNRTKACFAKSGGNAAAAAFQQGIDQTKAQWEAMADKSSLASACTTANDQFAQTASMLKCE